MPNRSGFTRNTAKSALLLAWMVLLCPSLQASPPSDAHQERRQRAVSLLRQALEEGREWTKVRAAESLLWNGYPQSVRTSLEKELEQAGPYYRIGLWRALARAQGNNEVAAQEYLQRIRRVFLDRTAPDRIHAAEALAKLGDAERLPELEQVSQAENGSFQVFARWTLANSGDPSDQEALAELLDSPQTRTNAAYALRHLRRLSPETVDRLRRLAADPALDSRSRVYLSSAWFVHASPEDKAEARSRLLAFVSGTPEERAEAAAALGATGEAQDSSVLDRLMEDPEVDVRVSAAHAALRIEKRQHRGLGWIDWLMMGLYGAAMLGIGWYTSRRQKSSEEYYVGSRNMSPFLVGIALFSALLSPISYLAHPGEMIKHGPVVLAGIVALPIVYFIVGYGLIPILVRLPITSAYELLEGKLGIRIRLLGSVIFILTRLVWMSLLIFLTAKALVVMMGWEPEMVPCIVIISGLITVVYTVLGGLRGVVLTNAVQFFIQVSGVILALFLIHLAMGGWSGWFPTAWAPNWDSQPFFSLDPLVRATVVGAVLNSVVFWICAAGSDQIAIQRYLATRDAQAARRAFGINLLASASVLVLLGMLGFALLAFFSSKPHLIADGRSLIGDADYLFPHFLANYLPVGIAGLVLVGIFADAMSSLSSAVNSISSVFMVDFIQRFSRETPSERRRVTAARILTLGIGVAVVLFSSVMDKIPGNLQEVAVKTNNLFLVPLFLLFFMALFVRFATPFGTAMGALYSFSAGLLMGFWDVFTGQPRLSFQWLAVASLLTGLLAGPLFSLFPVPSRRLWATALWTALALLPLLITFSWVFKLGFAFG